MYLKLPCRRISRDMCQLTSCLPLPGIHSVVNCSKLMFSSIRTPAVYFIDIIVLLDLKVASEFSLKRAEHLKNYSFIYTSNHMTCTSRLSTLYLTLCKSF